MRPDDPSGYTRCLTYLTSRIYGGLVYVYRTHTDNNKGAMIQVQQVRALSRLS